MNKITLTIVFTLLCIASSVSAQTNRAKCEAKYPNATTEVLLICTLTFDIEDIRLKISVGEEGQEKKMYVLTQALKVTQAQLTTMRQQLSQPARPTPQPAGTNAPQRLVGGVSFVVRDAPGQNVATTFDPGGERLEIARLDWGKETWKRGALYVRIVVQKNGVILPIAHADPAAPWNSIYASIKEVNGVPDRKPYQAVNPDEIASIFIPQVGPEDIIELIYLSDTGKRVLVPNFPELIVWGYPIRVAYDRVRRHGRFSFQSYGGSQR